MPHRAAGRALALLVIKASAFALVVIEASAVDLASIAADAGPGVVLVRKWSGSATSRGRPCHRPVIEASAVVLVTLVRRAQLHQIQARAGAWIMLVVADVDLAW